MKKKLIVLLIALVLIIGIGVPIINACTCTAADGGGCSGNCCVYANGVCTCLDWGAPGCAKQN